jgi:hypothetical protein
VDVRAGRIIAQDNQKFGGAWGKHMAQHKKVGIGIGIVGFPLAVLGFIFLVGGNVGVGLPILACGLGFVVLGAAAARKAASPSASTGAQPPAGGDSGRA